MNFLYLVILLIVVIIVIGAKSPESSTVYFSKDLTGDGVVRIYERAFKELNGKVAIKIHFGEKGNKNYLAPELIEKLTNKLNATLVETNVLYRGQRRFTEQHLKLAKEHGFDFAPIDILNSEGEKVIPAELKHFNSVSVGSHMDKYDNFLIISHFKGHVMAGFGGAIKNVAMGLASISGKMAIHASTLPVCRDARCIACGDCVKNCTEGAITLNPLVIDADKCIGCGKCIGVCAVGAIQVPWGSTSKHNFNEKLVDYASGITKNYPMVYINILANISQDCDCDGTAHDPFVDDIGILASTDIVAIERASLDLVNKAYNCEDAFAKVNGTSGDHQINYAFKIGLGNTNYKLIDIDK